MAYRLVLKPSAAKELRELPAKDRRKVCAVLVAIERDPFCGKKLSGELRGLFSFRAWPYRILYQIQRGLLLVIVIRVGQRKDVYR